MKKKLVSLFLVLALCLACVPVTALANDDHHDHDGWTALTVDTIKEDGTLPPGSYYLSEDVNYTGSNSIMITTGTVTLCLNGRVLDLGGKNITIDKPCATALLALPRATWIAMAYGALVLLLTAQYPNATSPVASSLADRVMPQNHSPMAAYM